MRKNHGLSILKHDVAELMHLGHETAGSMLCKSQASSLSWPLFCSASSSVLQTYKARHL